MNQLAFYVFFATSFYEPILPRASLFSNAPETSFSTQLKLCCGAPKNPYYSKFGTACDSVLRGLDFQLREDRGFCFEKTSEDDAEENVQWAGR